MHRECVYRERRTAPGEKDIAPGEERRERAAIVIARGACGPVRYISAGIFAPW